MRLKRIISMVLTLCMVIGALPAIAHTTAEAATDLYFNFVKGNIGTGKGTAHVKTIIYENTTSGAANEYNTTIPSEPWAFKSCSAGVDGGGGYFAYMNNGCGLYLYANTNNTEVDTYSGQIKFKVSTAGNYIPQLNLMGSNNFSHETLFTATIYEYTPASDTLGKELASRTIMYPSYDAADHYVSLTNTPVSFKANTEYVIKLSTYANCAGTFVVDGLKLVDASTPIATDLKVGDNEGLYNIKVGESKLIPLTAVMSNGSAANFASATVNVSNPSDVEATISNGQLKLTGLGEDDATVTVKLGAAMARFEVKSRSNAPVAESLTYNFIKPVNGKDKKNYAQAYLENITFANTTNGAHGEINDDVVSAPWAFLNSNVSGGNSYVKYNLHSTHGVAMYIRNDYANFKIYVPYDGMYTASAVLRGTNPYIQLSLHELSNNDAGKKIFGAIDLGSATDAEATYTVNNIPTALKAGYYVLQLKLGSQASAFAYLNSFTLNYTGEYNAEPDGGNPGGNQGGGSTTDETKLTVTSNVNKISVANGNTGTAILTVKNSSGSAVAATATVSGVDSTIATVTTVANGTNINVSAKGLKVGTTTATINLSATGGKTGSISIPITVTAPIDLTGGKTRSSYHTTEKVEAMRENAKLYDWANSTMRGYVNNAEKYVGEEERLWNVITSQELPRSYYVGYRADPDKGKCRYCNKVISDIYGSFYYCWMIDAWNKPWKVTCPECRKSFPTNDFEKFYELGIDADGFWNYELAKSE
ncbi:MAG: hypothetical protein IKU25_05040, partial [Clostridia bacterium]|nr:hypothetical protein [Clostridia bacterium]